MTAVLLVFQIAQPRIFFVMARDGLIPKFFARVHKKFRTPHITTWGTTIVVALCAGFMDLSIVIELCNIGTLFAFILVCLGVIIMRRQRPDIVRPFRTPLVPWVPIGGIVCCLYLVAGMPSMTWIRFLVWMVIGTIIYLCYGYKHSTMLNSPLSAHNCVFNQELVDGKMQIASAVVNDSENDATKEAGVSETAN